MKLDYGVNCGRSQLTRVIGKRNYDFFCQHIFTHKNITAKISYGHFYSWPTLTVNIFLRMKQTKLQNRYVCINSILRPAENRPITASQPELKQLLFFLISKLSRRPNLEVKHIIQAITKLLSLIFEHCSDQRKINYYHHFKQLFIILLIIKF